MRSLLIAAFLFLVTAESVGIAADRPIPQDPVFMKQRLQEWLAWNRLTLGDFYKTSGKKSPKWDEPVEATLEQAARLYSLQDEPFVTPADIHKSARQAVEEGCDDPLILYLYAQSSTDPDFPGEAEFIRRAQKASDALLASNCSPFRKASGLLKATQYKGRQAARPPTADQAREIEAGLDKIFELLAQSVKVDPRGEFWEARWYGNLDGVFDAYRGLIPDYKQAYDRFDDKLAKVNGVEALRLTLKGSFYKEWAWKGRSDAIAPMVSGKQFQTFDERLSVARSALEAAYKLNPKEPNVARIMIAVEIGSGEGGREGMELWFRRALELDPNDADACLEKHSWLEPKWHGDPEGKEALAFGKACAATKNWRNGLNLIAADAYCRHGATLPRLARQIYYHDAENWQTVEDVFTEYMKYYPDNYVTTSKYAYLAYCAGRIDIANTMFKRVGDNLINWAGTTTVTMQEMKRARDYVSKMKADQMKRKAAEGPKG